MSDAIQKAISASRFREAHHAGGTQREVRTWERRFREALALAVSGLDHCSHYPHEAKERVPVLFDAIAAILAGEKTP